MVAARCALGCVAWGDHATSASGKRPCSRLSNWCGVRAGHGIADSGRARRCPDARRLDLRHRRAHRRPAEPAELAPVAFTSLVGTSALSVNFQAEGNIYQSATYDQRVQAAQNNNLPAVPTLIWQANNYPSPLDASVQAALANSIVMSQVSNAFGIPNVASRATFLKSNTSFTTYTSYGQSGPYTLVNIDPHPFQTNPVVWTNQWTNATVPCPTGTPASSCPVAVQTSNWTSDNTNTTSGSFPSALAGHPEHFRGARKRHAGFLKPVAEFPQSHVSPHCARRGERQGHPAPSRRDLIASKLCQLSTRRRYFLSLIN